MRSAQNIYLKFTGQIFDYMQAERRGWQGINRASYSKFARFETRHEEVL
jgi:hypothetical protein